MRLVLKVALGVVAVLLASTGYMFWVISQENPSPITELNTQSSQPKAMVISDPGVSGFESGVASVFADGLTDNWHVFATTASSQTPKDLSGYSLVVLSAPIYGGQPSIPMQNYMASLTTLQGIKIVSLLTGAGTGVEANAWMTERINALRGTEVLSLVLFSMAPNEQQYGSTDPFVIAASAAQSID